MYDMEALGTARPFKREVTELNSSLTYAMHNGLELSVSPASLKVDVAVTSDHPIGVDVERIDADVNLARLIDQVLPLSQAVLAHELTEAREGLGKILLDPTRLN